MQTSLSNTVPHGELLLYVISKFGPVHFKGPHKKIGRNMEDVCAL